MYRTSQDILRLPNMKLEQGCFIEKEEYEAHIIVEPVEGKQLENLKLICKSHGFKVANLVMIKDRQITGERSNRDTFVTGRGDTYQETLERTRSLADGLLACGFSVWRYKIEKTMLDVRFDDSPVPENKGLSCSQLADPSGFPV